MCCAGGGIGQPLSLLLKMNKLVTELALYDIAGTPGVAADLSHCNTPVTVSAYTGDEELEACLTGADLVIIPAGIPRKPGMSRDDLFNTNAGAAGAFFCMLICTREFKLHANSLQHILLNAGESDGHSLPIHMLYV